jgi:hypothetical protein
LFFSIDPGYRGKKGGVKTQYSNLHDDENEVFYVPDNVYIIGTMNDIDRSVESFDFAMRRRFTWKEITAESRIEMWGDAGWADKAKECMPRLNYAIETHAKLTSAYHIGPAYFLKLNEYNSDFEQLWQYHIAILLKEYLRGMPNETKIFQELEDAYYDKKNEDNG